MSQTYKTFAPITPPRTEVRQSRDFLPSYEAKNWWAQIKRNGTRSVIFVPPNREVFAWNRHGEPHKTWPTRSAQGHFDPAPAALFKSLYGRKWFVLDGELLHHKTKHIKHIHYLYDVLVYDGVYLTGTTYEERYNLLLELWPSQETVFGHYTLDAHTWLARNYTENFRGLFDGLTAKEDEGIVVKNPKGVYYVSNCNGWMSKFVR